MDLTNIFLCFHFQYSVLITILVFDPIEPSLSVSTNNLILNDKLLPVTFKNVDMFVNYSKFNAGALLDCHYFKTVRLTVSYN